MKSASILTPQILLVDDNRDGLLVRRSLLEELGYQVKVANCGEEGLKLYETTNPDVVVTDFRMPHMDGIELIRRIRTLNANARIVLLSAFVEPLGLTEANTGADAVIAKSANEPVQLLRTVKRLVNKAALRKPPTRQNGTSSKTRRKLR
ncbi:MAG TPA: response regulator [Candidatus Limnocylindrales bacterium]|nr:response regulator [Candidatus Limnocylindrales bacterium]